MAIDNADIEKVAKLARISINDDAIAEVTQSISDILSMVDQMQAVDTDNVEPMANALDATQRLRADEVTEANQRDALLSQAPAVENGLVLVPKVIE